MPSSDHFIPILDEIRARVDAENSPPARKHPNWGGRRPGAGAPKGNLNGLRHGRHSRLHKQMALVLAQIPEFQQGLTAISKRRRSRERAAQAGAAAMLAELLRRVGEAVIMGPAAAGTEGQSEGNHLEPDQDFLDIAASARGQNSRNFGNAVKRGPLKCGPINYRLR